MLAGFARTPATTGAAVGDRPMGAGPKAGGLSRERCVGRDTLAVVTWSTVAAEVAVVAVLVVMVMAAVRTGLLSVGDVAGAGAREGGRGASDSSSDTDSI